MTSRAIIVGAGLAGLTTADRLLDAGWTVQVLEASDRVGGRAFTRNAGFVNGQHAEAGAEWIDTVHSRVHAMVERFGLSVDPNRTTWTAVRRWLFRSGRLLGPTELLELSPTLFDDLDRFEDRIAEIAEGIDDAARPDLHPRADEFDALSVADLIDELGLGELATLFAMRNIQGEFAAEPSDVSLLFIAQQRAVYAQSEARHGTVEAQRLTGGVSGLTKALAASLPVGTIALRQQVASARTDSAGVHVRTTTDTFEADVLVCACSLIALRSVRFEPALPSLLDEAIHGLGYGTVTKTALQYPSRVWAAGYATTESPMQRVYEPTAASPAASGILMAYTGGAQGRALGELPEHDRMALIESSERDMYPDLPVALAGFSQAWSAEPLFGGSYAVYRPGEIGKFWNVLRRAHGSVHLAGEHTATWTGYLEGAIESGETVASRLITQRG